MRRLFVCLILVMLFSGIFPASLVTAQTGGLVSILQPTVSEDCTLRLSFQIGKTYYWRNGLIKGAAPDTNPAMGTAPEIKGGRTFLIIRYVTAEVGAKLEYWKKNTPENQTKQDQVRITTKTGRVIDLWIGNPEARIDGKNVSIDPTDSSAKVVPYIKGKGYTMLPLRFIGDNLGAKINWITETSTAELIFTDQDCLERCCDFDISPVSPISLCPGELKSVDIAVKNLCQAKNITLTLSPQSNIISLDPPVIELGKSQTAIVRAGLVMPDVITDFATFTLTASSSCGQSRDFELKGLFKADSCQNDCEWVCGCISKVEQRNGVLAITFLEGCDSKMSQILTDPKLVKDTMLGMTVADYFAKNGANACADVCFSDSGEVVAWKARPDRKPCCQDRVLLTIEMTSCKKGFAVGVDPNGSRWVVDPGDLDCSTFEVGQCYDVGGIEMKPAGTAFVLSHLLKANSAKPVSCTGQTICGTVEAKNCKVNPQLLMLAKTDGQSVEVRVEDTKIKSIDGRTIECSEIPNDVCVSVTGYMEGSEFVGLQIEQVPCPCDLKTTTIDCRLEQVNLTAGGTLEVMARTGCDGDLITYSAPKSLSDSFRQYRNLLAYSKTGVYARLTIDSEKIISWNPGLGCSQCMPEVLVNVLDVKNFGIDKGLLAVCKNTDGRIIAVYVAKDLVSSGIHFENYRGPAKLQTDLNGNVTAWRSLEGACCEELPIIVRPSGLTIITSSQTTEIALGEKTYVASVMSAQDVQAKLGSKLINQPYPWENLKNLGAQWIVAPSSVKPDQAVYVASFCVPVCTRVRLQMLAPAQTDVHLDGTLPGDIIGTVKGIAHVSEIIFNATPGKHTLRFVSKGGAGSGIIFALTGQDEQKCDECQLQISPVTDPSRVGLCQGQKRKYLVRVANSGINARAVEIKPTSMGVVVNPSQFKLEKGSETLVELTVQMPFSSGDEKTATLACTVETDCGKPFVWTFDIPYVSCPPCSITGSNTLIVLPQMCPGDSAKADIQITNTCSDNQTFSITTSDKPLSIPKSDLTIKASETSSFSIQLSMPEMDGSKYFVGSFILKSATGGLTCYDVVAPYKDDCSCEFDIKLLTQFVQEQTMKPGDTFTYNYRVTNNCKSRRLAFVMTTGANITGITPNSFILDAGKSIDIAVTVLMPTQESEYADFGFAIKSDCGKQQVISFRVKYAQTNTCCDFDVGFVQTIPKPFMLEPGAQYVLVLGIKNNCEKVTLIAHISGLENVTSVDPERVTVDPGQIGRFRVYIQMPECQQGQVANFKFRVLVDGCQARDYNVAAVCGKQIANCCDVGLRDDANQLKTLRICPGETKSFVLTLVNLCNDKSLSAKLSGVGGGGCTVDPPNVYLEAGQSTKITVTITIPANATPGQELVFTVIIEMPGCQTKQFSFKISCTPCNSSQDCCEYLVNVASKLPACVYPGQTLTISFELCNMCDNDLTILFDGTGMEASSILVPARKCGTVRVTCVVPQNCPDSVTIVVNTRVVVPQTCANSVKRFDFRLACCK